MSKKLTPWFPANVNPVRVGVYEIETDQFEAPNFRGWLGNGWSATAATPRDWMVNSELDCLYQPGEGLKGWRGLAAKGQTV